jgi:excisionase family DNA binding protein
MDAPRLLHLAALARRLGVPATWLRKEADSGRLPCVKAGTQRLFDADAIERLLLERARRDPTEEEAR